MGFMDPDGPIEELREDLIRLIKRLAAMEHISDEDRDEVVAMLKWDDELVRAKAQDIRDLCKELGIKIEQTRH